MILTADQRNKTKEIMFLFEIIRCFVTVDETKVTSLEG
jgi:hypothetical protein